MKIRRWILLDLWILSLASISIYGGAVSYGFFWGITLIPVVSLLYLAAVYLNLRLYQQIESRNMVCGQAVPYLFMLKNESLIPFVGINVGMYAAFSMVEKLPEGTAYELLPGDQWTFETKLTCQYRGEYEVGVREIVMTDFLRLFRIRYRIPHAVKAQVLPRVTRLSELQSVGEFTELLQRESMRAHTEPDMVVRDYVPGDALKQIHWKATAREQKLKVRGRTGEEKQGIAILCDTRRYSREQEAYLPLEDKMLETVVALGLFLAERNIPFSVYYGQKEIRHSLVRGIEDFDGFYDDVAGIVFDWEEKFGELLAQLDGRGILMANRIVFGVLHEMNDEILRLAMRQSETGTFVILYVVTDEDVERYSRQGSARCRIIALPIQAQLAAYV